MERICKAIGILAGLGFVLCLTGCGHNIGTAFNGRVINVGYDPELNKIGVQYYNGLLVTGIQRENSETNLNFEDAIRKDGNTESLSKFQYKQVVGQQINGYTVKLEEAKQEVPVDPSAK